MRKKRLIVAGLCEAGFRQSVLGSRTPATVFETTSKQFYVDRNVMYNLKRQASPRSASAANIPAASIRIT
jgi:hypothetical protein